MLYSEHEEDPKKGYIMSIFGLESTLLADEFYEITKSDAANWIYQ